MERARRLPGGAAFESVYSRGTVTSGPFVVLRVLPNGGEATRWGFAVGKRLSKKAVVRNRLRRQLREASRQLRVAEGFDIVVTARPKALEASFADLREALRRAAGRAGLTRSDP